MKANIKNGFTLLETLLALLLFSVLLSVSGFLFTVSLRAWDAGRLRAGIREDINYAVEKTVRDLKGMQEGSLSQFNSIAHTFQFSDLDGETHMFYLYNQDDPSFDSTYGESSYNLRKATISQGDDPDLGEGVLILRDLVSPDASQPATDLTISGDKVTLDIVVQRGEETLNIRTKVRPRNL